MSKSTFDVKIAEEQTKQIKALVGAITDFSREFSKAGVHDNVKARAVEILANLEKLIERTISKI